MKLTPELLRQLVLEEMSKFKAMKDVEDVDADEVDADGYAKKLEAPLDHTKHLKLKEARLIRELNKVRAERRRAVGK